MKRNIPIFVTHYGCPNQCVFCNQKKISGASQAADIQACEKILAESSKRGYIPEETEIAFFGGSFTGISIEEQIKYLETAKKYRLFFHGIRLSTRPDYINDEILQLLKDYGVTTIELGVQSMVDNVLQKNKRGMDSSSVIKAVQLIRQYDFSLGLQMMLSMYGSTEADDLFTADSLVALKPDFVRIYPTVVLEDTQLYELYQRGEYQIKTLEETVQLSALVYQKFTDENIPVIRIGLMSSEEIKRGKVIGAYHEAFGELVQNEIYYRKLSSQLSKMKTEGKHLKVFCKKHLISQIIGHQKNNVIRLKEQFGVRSVKAIPFEHPSEHEITICLESMENEL